MSEPIVLSDEEDDFFTPSPILSKKRRTEFDPNIPIFVIDDPTPHKPGSASTPLVVPETPLPDFSIVKCTGTSLDPQIRVPSTGNIFTGEPLDTSTPLIVADTPIYDSSFGKCTVSPSHPQIRVPSPRDNFTGVGAVICLESDNDSELGGRSEGLKEDGKIGGQFDVANNSEWSSRFIDSSCSLGYDNSTQVPDNNYLDSVPLQASIHQVHDYVHKENVSVEKMDNIGNQKAKGEVNARKKKCVDQPTGKNRKTIEERICLVKEKKLRKEQEKLQKAALKAEAAEMKKLQKETQQWEKGKLALKSIVAEIDSKVVEMGAIGGHMLTRFSEKGLTFRITSNPIERSIIWTMNVPEKISQFSSRGSDVQYLLLVYEAEEFCNLVNSESLMEHISGIRSRYPSYTICYLTNRLMSYINKREQEQYKNGTDKNRWKRPPVEEVLAKLSTNFHRVHSRQCIDEAELAEHIVGLTCSLATCQFRKKLTRLSVNASELPKDAVDRITIKKSLWLKTLVAIPKVQPRFAIAIWKKYPTMKSLLSVYMDPSKLVHEKEFLLKDLTIEGLLGNDRRLGEVCSKRVYRVLMAPSGSIKTDDIEDGAGFFAVNSLNS